jgi:MORN repeat variant
MNLKECETILATAIKLGACKGNADAARRYLDAGDAEGFERVCRGNYRWLEAAGIAYVLTDGVAERWHDNGRMYAQSTYVSGKPHGEYFWWHVNGQMGEKSNYVNGKTHGECTWWYSDGQMREQASYVDGVKQP